MFRIICCLALLTIQAMPSAAEEPLDPRITPEVLEAFAAHTFDDEDFKLPYRLLSPTDLEEGERAPLLLFLHGFGERGDENQRQLIHGGQVLASPEFRTRHRAFVVAPQCPAGTEPGILSNKQSDPPGTEAQRVWGFRLSTKQPAKIDLKNDPSRQLSAALKLVKHLIAELPVDPDRIYVSGLSMGGYATWELAIREPNLWAAAVPICGSGDPDKADRLVKLPLWAHHGEMDYVVPVDRSREMIDAIQQAGGKPIYSEYPGVGHDSWTPTLNSRHVWDWLFTQKRSGK